jgi:primosomal protein N''
LVAKGVQHLSKWLPDAGVNLTRLIPASAQQRNQLQAQFLAFAGSRQPPLSQQAQFMPRL